MAAAVSPPKPWEKANAMSSSAGAASTPTTNPHTTTPTSSTSTAQLPELPSKPSSLNSVVNRAASNYSSSPYNSSRYGNSPYGSNLYGNSPYGNSAFGTSSYSSPYSRMGGMGNSMFGGGYGGMYGGYGGMGGMYGGMGQPGMMGVDPNNPNSLTQSFSQSTQATFQIIENLVGAFGGIAQMLESTYMATHSSFFAMVSVAEQFSNLRTTLGSILGVFTLLRYLRTLIAKITGRPPPADATSLTPSAFASFQGLSPSGPSLLPNGQPVPSKKPFLIFLAAIVGLPYLMTKLIRSLAAQNEQNHQPDNQLILGPNGQPLPDQVPLDPSKLEFCRVLYDYHPHMDPGQQFAELEVKTRDIVAVLSKSDPMGNPSDWWRCRSRGGQIGYLPGVYLEPIPRKPQAQLEETGRANTLNSVIGGSSSRTNSLKVEKEKSPVYK